jgi:endonuclease-3
MVDIQSFFLLLHKSVKDKKSLATLILIEEYGKNPFLILLSCILSLRTRDTITLQASRRLFASARTPEEIIQLDLKQLENLIYPVGFYSKKSITLQKISLILIEKYEARVPSIKNELLKLPGVGIKTTNLVLAEAFDIPAICVDTHVHRLSNLCGLVKTKTPEETEKKLQKIIPLEFQRDFSRYMVALGQGSKKNQNLFIEEWNNYSKRKTSILN